MIDALSRLGDPLSSHRGADYIRPVVQSQITQIYEALKKHPRLTARELSRASGIDYYIIQRRLSVLEKRGLAEVAGERPCRVSSTGIPARVWVAK